MGALTMRSKIRVYWTTNPADLGYDGLPTNGKHGGWKGGDARYDLCSMRAAERFNYKLGQRVGPGTYRAVAYYHDGHEIMLGDIKDVIDEADCRRLNR